MAEYAQIKGGPGSIDLSGLQTETRNPRTAEIDQVSTLRMCTLINEEDGLVSDSVTACLPVIADAIDSIAARIRRGGRLVYVGAGTSGRLGILDASEIPPTFSADPAQFVGLIAGGEAAIRHAQEGAEDSVTAAEMDLQQLNLDLEVDSLIGIAASGRTPYVLECLSYAKKRGCLTVGLACCQPSTMSESGLVDFMISPLPGPEVVTGSTRLKAGTATKMVLNMLSTGIMIRIGKTYGNLMVDVRASNLKLEERSRNMLRSLSESCKVLTNDALNELLQSSGGSVKLALVQAETGLDVEQARLRLDQAGGVLSKVLRPLQQAAATGSSISDGIPSKSDLVLCIDGGGTKCAAVIADDNGILSTGETGPCNFTEVGLEGLLAAIRSATEQAFEKLYQAASTTTQARVQRPTQVRDRFATAWIGLAGFDRPAARKIIQPAVSEMLGLDVGVDLRITSDVDLLAAALTGIATSSHSAVVLIAGTGSIAMSYKVQNQFPVRQGRAGGWGHILGDEGGGFDIGRRATKATMHAVEDGAPLGLMHREVFKHFGISIDNIPGSDLLNEILSRSYPSTRRDQESSLKAQIAGVARVVLSVASQDPVAMTLVSSAADDLARTLLPLVGPAKGLDPSASTLVLGGGLVRNEGYRAAVLERLSKLKVSFGHVEVVQDPARVGAEHLAGLHKQSPS